MAAVGELGHGEGRPKVPRIVQVGQPISADDAVRPSQFRLGEVSTIDVHSLLSALRRRMRLIGLVAASVMALVIAVTYLTPPKYLATAEVMLDPRNKTITKADDVLSQLPADSVVVDSEVEVLRSPQLSKRVVKSLRLDEDPEFRKGLKHLAPGPLTGEPLQRVVNTVRRNLDISRMGLTDVIQIGFRSENPAKAAQVANEFANLYLAQQVEQKVDATSEASQWLNQRLSQIRSQVLADDTAVQQFKIANNLLSAQGATLTEQEISNYNQSLATATAQVAEDQARLDTAKRQLATGSNGDDVGEALNSPTIEKLKEQRAEVSRQVAVLQSQFLDGYPKLETARSELKDIDAEIRSETQRIISNLDAKVQVSRRRAAAIDTTLSSTRGELATNDRASVRLDELEHNAEASRSLYESYLARYKETSSQEGLAQPDSRLVSLAPLPTKPSSPNIPLNMLVGLVLAAGSGLGAFGLAELLDSGVATSADVEKRFKLRYLGAVPLLSSVARRSTFAPIDYVVAKPFSSFSEAFRSLRAAIVHGPNPMPVKTVAVTSALPNEGKTTTAVCLARSAALQGIRVVLVDCDLRRGSLNRLASAKPGHGLLEVLAGRAQLTQALVRDSATECDILPLSDGAISQKDVFGSPAMDRLLAQLGDLYELVVLDAPPVLPTADARILARKADFTVLVARWRATPYQAIESAMYVLSGNNVEVGGIVLNQVDMKQQARYGYGDIAYHFNSYRTYYLDSPSHNVIDQSNARSA